MPTLEEYKNILKDYSFSDIKIWNENSDKYFPDKEYMIGWIDQPNIVPFLKYIPDDKKELFRDIVIEQMLKEALQEDGRCLETYRRINVSAKR